MLCANTGRFIVNNSNVYVPRAQLAEITSFPHARVRISHASIFPFCTDARVCEVREVSSALGTVSWSRPLASEFRLLHEATGGNPLCFSHRRAASNPDQYNPKPPVRVFPKPVYRVDRRENARAAGAKSRFWIFAASYLVTVMRPICATVPITC